MLEKGTSNKSAQDIADTLDLYGASLEVSPGFDFVSVSLYALKSKLADVFPLFLEILTDPVFPESEWILAKDIFLQNLKISLEKTSYRAGNIFRGHLYGGAHPYGSTIGEQAVNAIASSDFSTFFRTHYKVHSIYWVGNLTDTECNMLAQGFSGLPGGTSFPVHPKDEQTGKIKEHIIKEGSLQSSIRIGCRTISKGHADYFDLLLFNHVLGGFFGSRLMKNIREEKGLTYGIYSSLNTFINDAAWIIGAEVNQSNLQLAIDEIHVELNHLQNIPVSPEELMLARNHFIGSLQTDMANLFSVIDKVRNIHIYQLPQSYYQDLIHRLDLVTPSDLIRIANTYLKESDVVEVSVG